MNVATVSLLHRYTLLQAVHALQEKKIRKHKNIQEEEVSPVMTKATAFDLICGIVYVKTSRANESACLFCICNK